MTNKANPVQKRAEEQRMGAETAKGRPYLEHGVPSIVAVDSPDDPLEKEADPEG